MQVAKAALTYWAAIFALGFVLGTARVLWIAPSVGETGAVLMELPVMLAASWLAARWLVRRFGIGSAGQALAVGALTFVLLMASEALLAAALGEGLDDWTSGWSTLPGALGLTGQIAFGLMPAVIRLSGSVSIATKPVRSLEP